MARKAPRLTASTNQIMLPTILAVVIIVTVIVAQAHSAAVLPERPAGELRIVTQTKEKIVAVYVLKDGSGGVHITSTVSDNSTCINITSLEGKEIIFARHSDIASASLLRIMGHAMVIRKTSALKEEDRRWVDYALPFEVSHHFDAAISQHNFPEQFSHHLKEDSVNRTKHLAFSVLLSTSSTHMMAEACQALGHAGIFGFENPAAMNLYSFVLRYENFQNDYQSNPELFDVESINNGRGRRKRDIISASSSSSSSSSKVCPSLSGLYKKAGFISRYLNNFDCDGNCPVGPECLGMCGPTCKQCWYILCGDCCRHEGCYQHDNCCDKRGFYHHSCFLPLKFSCDSYVCRE